MAIDFPVGNDFPANGNQIPDGHIYEGFYWDAATGAWKRLCERDKIGDCLDDNTNETVCDKLDELQREIVELEEEIDAIATSLDRGSWAWDFNVTNYLDARLGSGKFYMVREPDLAVVTEYKDAARIVFHEDDIEGENHVFDDTMIDKVLMLFDRPDDDFIESVITAVETTSGTHGTAYIVHVNVAQSKGSPTNAPDAEGVYKARLNIFEQPSGGTVGEYVLKAGGDPGGVMTGKLILSRTLEDIDYTTPGNTDGGYINFQNEKPSNSAKNSVALYKPGPYSAIVSNTAFYATNVRTTGYYYGYYQKTEDDGRKTRATKNVSIYLSHDSSSTANAENREKDFGLLRYSTSGDYSRVRWDKAGGELCFGTSSSTNRKAKLTWNANRVVINKPVGDSTNAEGFTIKGTRNKNGYASTSTSTNLEYNATLLNVYHNNGSNDAINYMGKITANSNNLVTTKYLNSEGYHKVLFQCNANNTEKGDMWYCSSDQTLYLKVS